MLPFFSRTLTRREMALGCAVLSLALLLSALPAALRWGQAQLDTGALLCADTLRFHIRADSDSPADQTAKLAVRDAVLAYADVHCTAQDKPAALRWAAENLPALELTARAVLAGRGIFSTVTVQLVEMYFDTTRYSTGILPAGRYQALRIDLGGNARHGKRFGLIYRLPQQRAEFLIGICQQYSSSDVHVFPCPLSTIFVYQAQMLQSRPPLPAGKKWALLFTTDS